MLIKCTKHLSENIEGFLVLLSQVQTSYLTEALTQNCEHPSCYEAFSQNLWGGETLICKALRLRYIILCI